MRLKNWHHDNPMLPFAAAFIQLEDKSWFCRAPASFDGPTGVVRATPGVRYERGRLHMGVDIAQWLDDWTKTGGPPPGVIFKPEW
jgi:hypothetical protein